MATIILAFVATIIVTGAERARQRDLDELERRVDALSALTCVLAHVDERAERITMRLYARGRLDRRAYLADYPDCK